VRKLIAIAALITCAACSTTPGDAAYRGGHPQQAAELYKKGAEQGDASAALKLGLMVEEESVQEAKFGTAGTWYVKACDLGSLPGCHNAGVGYEYGKGGLVKDLAKARDFYEKAALKGYMQSAYNLGSLYANNYFSNDTEGLKWLLVSQAKARECTQQPLCNWILEDPPGHIGKLKGRMSAEQIKQAENAAAHVH
jgi:hypothetical protein